ncbi:MAG TPA: transglycosylase domain-containing protein [Aliidongia sp.]|nr:transglycosylase domain-containing protein [Aliidongia sp.]
MTNAIPVPSPPPSRLMLRRAVASARRSWWLPPLLALALFLWQRSTFIEPRPSAILTDRHGAFLAQLAGGAEGYGYWPVDKIPDRVAAAILALEDRRFWDHPGIDPLAILRAARANLAGPHRSGASTLAMQLARMQYPAARGYLVKTVEAATALLMTARYGRLGVFEQYLRLVPLGQNSHGIAHAARWYFNKPVEDLSWAEIAFLSAIPQSPSADNPGSERGRERIVERGGKALARLREQGVIDDTELAQARLDLADLRPRTYPTRPPEALHAILHIADLAKAGPPIEQIRSTLDLGLQRLAAKLARERLATLRAEGAQQLALIIADRSSREVLAMVGSDRYGPADAGQIDYALRTRSPGSTLKPFIFAEALEDGAIAPSTILNDTPDNGTGIDNADRRFLGPLLPRQALGNSRNVPAASLVRLNGLDRTYWFLANLGLHDEARPADRYGLTLSVGGLPTALDRLVTAYGAIANDGELAPLRWYRDQTLPAPRQVLGADTARIVTAFLADPMARLPSFARMGSTEYPFPVAIKTGTSQGYRDAWVAAFTERYLIGVWVGRPDGRPMAGLSGASSAALVARDLLTALHEQDMDGMADGAFKPPQGLRAVALCAATGLPSDGGCARELTEYVSAVPVPGLPPREASRRLRIVAPLNHTSFIRNPEAPPGSAFLPLRVGPEAGDGQIVWYVDGRPYRTAGTAETVRWPVEPGRHRIEARPAFGEGGAAPVEVTIQ